MPTLRFEGASDDTFGEYAHFRDDYDNCASGEPIVWRLTGPVIDGRPPESMLVIGQYCPGEHATGWMIGVARCEEDDDAPLQLIKDIKAKAPIIEDHPPARKDRPWYRRFEKRRRR